MGKKWLVGLCVHVERRQRDLSESWKGNLVCNGGNQRERERERETVKEKQK
jgi:hypothetical protein